MDRAQEKAFVRKLAKMDGRTWELFCREYSLPLREYVQFSFGCGREKAEEVVQMTFVRCVRSIHTFKPSRGRLFGWLKAVSRNEAHTLMDDDTKTVATMPLSALAEPAVDEILEQIGSSPIPDEFLAGKDLQLLVQETLLELNSRYREAVVEKYVGNLKVSEIARRMKTSEKAVESVLARARAAFRRALLEKIRSREAKAGRRFYERV
ncbi:MAG: RNA polymerase sigma factor [Planctomycetota bacterium]|jgi:RNA polymerase sigma-70 factor (ECF subfamily)